MEKNIIIQFSSGKYFKTKVSGFMVSNIRDADIFENKEHAEEVFTLHDSSGYYDDVFKGLLIKYVEVTDEMWDEIHAPVELD